MAVFLTGTKLYSMLILRFSDKGSGKEEGKRLRDEIKRESWTDGIHVNVMDAVSYRILMGMLTVGNERACQIEDLAHVDSLRIVIKPGLVVDPTELWNAFKTWTFENQPESLSLDGFDFAGVEAFTFAFVQRLRITHLRLTNVGFYGDDFRDFARVLGQSRHFEFLCLKHVALSSDDLGFLLEQLVGDKICRKEVVLDACFPNPDDPRYVAEGYAAVLSQYDMTSKDRRVSVHVPSHEEKSLCEENPAKRARID